MFGNQWQGQLGAGVVGRRTGDKVIEYSIHTLGVTADQAGAMDENNSYGACPDCAEQAAEFCRLEEFDPRTDSVIETIVTAVAELAETSPGELDPLYSAVDPDALDGIITSVATNSNPADAEITVRYHGYVVTVHSYGVVEIASSQN